MPPAYDEDRDTPREGLQQRPARRVWRRRLTFAFAAAVLIAAASGWLSRERIAGDVIDDYLAERGVAATYDIVAIGPAEQVIENLVIGDPARPDLTVGRIEIAMGVGWAGPEVREVRVEQARLFARFTDGTVTLGALDPLVFTGSDGPPALPALRVVLVDGRALVETDFGRVGIKLEGAGPLDDGFAGTLAMTAPGAGVDDCRARAATLYGTLTTDGGAASLQGPLRLGDLTCGGMRLARADIGTRMTLTRDFSAAVADLTISGREAAGGVISSTALAGEARITWSTDRLALAHDLTLTGIAAPQGRLASLRAEGSWRGPISFASGQWDGTVQGAGLAPVPGLTASLDELARSAEGTLIAPLIAKADAAMTHALTGADLRGQATLRHKGSDIALVISEASIVSRRGARIAALSRASAGFGQEGLSRLSGDLLVGGEGLPSINGRIEHGARGRDGWSARLAMADYASGGNRLAIPRLSLRAAPGGAVQFDGIVRASGALPGGGVRDLELPLEGAWSNADRLALGSRCTPIGFGRLALSGLTLAGQELTLCPQGGAPILAYRDTLTLAARTGPLRLAGTLGESPVVLTATGAVLRYPQPFAIEGLTARIGTGQSEVRLASANLTGRIGTETGGTLTQGTARLAAVPLDLDTIAGRWSFADGVLRLTEGALTVSDRPEAGAGPRFNPLMARDAALTLADSRITAGAMLRHPDSGREIVQVAITHDLGSAAGSALLTVPGVVFDKSFQPDDLTSLSKGVIASADGTVTGTGRIDWSGKGITSSGTFATDKFDFAAAFGPVRGVAGQVVFADLLSLTTAPDQRLAIGAINPGVEVLDGTVQFELDGGTLLTLEDARFPFFGGQLQMRPLAMDFSRPEQRRYVFEITGLDAAAFVAQMELTNINATGIFDGTVPIVFDADGNGRIEDGLLIARPGGGNVAYVGELTYEDLGTMANFAFAALRSLDYKQMRVALGGDLAGEIVTRFEFDGVQQGAGTRQNFITRRIGRLPIRFRVNVRSESFFELATMVRSFFDSEYLGDPRTRFDVRDGRLVPVLPPVQPSESEDQP